MTDYDSLDHFLYHTTNNIRSNWLESGRRSKRSASQDVDFFAYHLAKVRPEKCDYEIRQIVLENIMKFCASYVTETGEQKILPAAKAKKAIKMHIENCKEMTM